MRKKHPINKRGFTLVEVMVAAGIAAMFMSVIFMVFSGIQKHFKKTTDILELDRKSRLVMEKIKNDLRSACTRGTPVKNLSASKFHKIIVENPDVKRFGMPKDVLGNASYVHGYTLKFFKYIDPPTNTSPPQAKICQYSFYDNFTLPNGKVKKAIVNYIYDDNNDNGKFDDGEGFSKILADFPLESETWLYFVEFSVDEITLEHVRVPDSGLKLSDVGTGGRSFVRIQFNTEIKPRTKALGKPVKLEIITTVGLRQINSMTRDTSWKDNSFNKLNINSNLLPSN